MGESAARRYTPIRPLATGGMAELFLARRDDAPGDIVALKRILPHLANDPTFVEMFLNEARVAATLHHENLVSVLDAGFEDGRYFLAMEYVHGADLGQLLERAAEADDLPLPVALTILRDACAGLHHLHDQTDAQGRALALVHRDVSPSNILVRTDGVVKVTDYGIATATAHTRTTRPGTIKGKASYMAPEQCTGGIIDRRADVFALGILLYETTLLTRLFVGDNEFALMMQVVQADIPPPTEVNPTFPPGLATIVAKALARNPEDRYQSAAHLQTAIEGFAARRSIVLSSAAVAEWFRRRVGEVPHPGQDPTLAVRPRASRRRAAWIGAAAGVLLAAGSAWALSRPAPEAVAPAAGPPPMTDAVPVATAAPAAPVIVPVPVATTAPPSAAEAAPDDIVIGDDAGEAPAPADPEIVIVDDERPRTRRSRRRPRRTTPAATPSYDLDQAAPPR